MQIPEPVTAALTYRALAFVSFLIGIVVAGIGVALGVSVSVSTLLADPNRAGEAIGFTSPVLTIVLVGLGFAIWQIGKTYALFLTLPSETARSVSDGFDNERLKSDVLTALDGRLAAMEEDVAETRRSVSELKRAEHAASFEREHTDVGPSQETQGGKSTKTPTDSGLPSTATSGDHSTATGSTAEHTAPEPVDPERESANRSDDETTD